MSNQCSDTGKISQVVSVEFCPWEGCDGIMEPSNETNDALGVCLKCGHRRE